ncbi:Suppressor of actin 1 [Giardia lamblia P15]|uniref:Suppressor of actin 1 n=1 Tax=Giardia intestinalis (strain P15) TaxID=658858 RepID=E1EXV7_GIAIA|nr:Suppressor of actin 1 [Giardia lamblia P15]
MVPDILCYQYGDSLILRNHSGVYTLDCMMRKLLPSSEEKLQPIASELSAKHISALLGILNYDSASYIIVATKLEYCVTYRPCDGEAVSSLDSMPMDVYSIDAVDVLVIGKKNNYVRTVLMKQFSQKGLYCAFDKRLIETSKYKSNRHAFHWNRNVSPGCGEGLMDLDVASCVPFVICGYIEETKPFVIAPGTTLTVLLISRRSLKSAGKRYFQRGIDAEGHTSNYVETEILATFYNEQSRTAFTCTNISLRGSIPVSFQQIPNLSQKPPIRITRDFPNNLSLQEFTTQQQRFERRYPGSKQVYLNLLDGMSSEGALSRRFLSLCNVLASSRSYEKSMFTFEVVKDTIESDHLTVKQVAPITPDTTTRIPIPVLSPFVVEFRKFNVQMFRDARQEMKQSRKILEAMHPSDPEAVELMQEVDPTAASDPPASETLHYPKSNVVLQTPGFSYVHLDFHSVVSHTFKGDMRTVHYFLRFFERDLNTPESVHSFIYRINCLDSLDRTNTVQLCICKEFVRKVVANVLCSGTHAGFPQYTPYEITLEEAFRHLNTTFWRHGNALSLQYATTDAMKGDLSIVGRRTFKGRMKDLRIWFTRWVTCNFIDGPLQDGYLFLRMSVTNPLQKNNEAFHLSFISLLVFLLAFAVLLLILLSQHASTSAIVPYLIIFLFGLVLFTFTCVLFSRWYVRWPRYQLSQYVRIYGERV